MPTTNPLELLRCELSAGEPYRFGFTLIDFYAPRAQARIAELLRRIRLLGTSRLERPVAMGGNFAVTQVFDVIGGRPIENCDPVPLSASLVQRHVERLRGRRSLTLRFRTPYRAQRPASACTDGHQYVDGGFFSAAQFMSRLVKRLRNLNFAVEGIGQAPLALLKTPLVGKANIGPMLCAELDPPL